MTMTKITDTEAMNRIHQLLDGTEWDSDTTQEIALVVRATEREIAEPGEYTREQLIELLHEDD
jgi:hypothetical protein